MSNNNLSEAESNELDPYILLNVPIDADFKAIKDRYFLLSRVFHPDKAASGMYLESREQFEVIDRAYKAISTPFLKLIYDHFGHQGIKICQQHPNKFIDLEEEYILVYEQRLLQRHEYKHTLNLLKKRILARMEHMIELFREERSYGTCYRNIVLNADFSGIQFSQEGHGKQLSMKNKSLVLTRLSFIPTLLLPNYAPYGIQHEIGFSASAAGVQGMQQDFNGGFIYKAQKKLPQRIKYIGDSDVKVSLYHSAKSTEGSLELSTTPMKNLNIVYGGRIGAFGIIPILSMNRVIDSTFSVNSSTTLVGSDISDANFGFVKVLPKLGVRIDGDINIQDSELNTDLIASKDINKKFSIIFGVSQKGEKKPQYWKLKLYVCIGWKVVLGSHNYLEVRSNFGMGHNELQIRYKRNGLQTSIPISFGALPTRSAVLIPTLFGVGSGAAMYLFQKYSKNSKRQQLILIKKHKNRLLDERSTFNVNYDELKIQIASKLQREILLNGLVILKAYGGKASKVNEILKVHKQQKYEILRTPEQILEAMQDTNNLDIGVNLDDVLCEIIELTGYVQAKVNHSSLDAIFSEIVNQQGLYDPCVDVNEKRALFILYSYQGVVKHHVLYSKQRICIGNIPKKMPLYSLQRMILRAI